MKEHEYQIFIEQLLHRVNQMNLSPTKLDLRERLQDFKKQMQTPRKTESNKGDVQK